MIRRVLHEHRNMVITAAVGMATFGMSAVTGPLLAHALGAAGKGDLAAVTVPSEVFGYLLAMGWPVASLYYAKHHSERSLVMSTWVFSLVVGGLAVLATWWLVPLFLHGHAHQTILWLRLSLLVMITFVPVRTSVDLQRARTTMIRFNVLLSMQLTLNAIALVVLAVLGHLDLTTALGASVGTEALWHVIVILSCRAWPRRGFRRVLFRLQLSYSTKLMFSTLSSMVVARLDQFLLVGIVSSRDLGLYSVAVTAASISSPAALGISQALFPRIHAIDDPIESWRLTRQALYITLASSILLAGTVAALASTVFPILFGPGFHGALVPLWILLPGQVAFDLANTLSQKLMADGQPGVVSRAWVAAAAVTAVGLALTVGPYGIVGAAAVTSVSEITYLAYQLWHYKQPGGTTSSSQLLPPTPHSELELANQPSVPAGGTKNHGVVWPRFRHRRGSGTALRSPG
jgi:O-antigen/teichoic acid export membrane protein